MPQCVGAMLSHCCHESKTEEQFTHMHMLCSAQKKGSRRRARSQAPSASHDNEEEPPAKRVSVDGQHDMTEVDDASAAISEPSLGKKSKRN